MFDRATTTARVLAGRIMELVARTTSGQYTPRSRALGNEGFQVTRGWLGVST